MVTTHVIIQNSKTWKDGLGKVEFLQLPRIGEIIGHEKDGKSVWFKVINVVHGFAPLVDRVDIYAVETADPNVL